MTIYHYNGPAMLLDIGEADEINLISGRVYDLDATAAGLAGLVAAGRLQPGAGKAIRPHQRPKIDNHAPDRNLLTDTIKAMREGVAAPAEAARAAAAPTQASPVQTTPSQSSPPQPSKKAAPQSPKEG